MRFFVFIFMMSFAVTSFALSKEAIESKEKAVSIYNLRDKVESGRYFLPAAKEGDPSSQYYYAVSIISRDGGLSNEAIKWLDKSANNGNLSAMFRLTGYELCAYGKSCPPKGKDWFDYAENEAKKRAEKGDGKAMYVLAIGYLNNEKDNLYYKWIEKSAKAEYSRGQYVWAKSISSGQGFYFTDSGRKEDAAKWAKKAFENGFPVGGYFYSLLNKDSVNSKEYMFESAKEGYARAMDTFALCLLDAEKFKCKGYGDDNKPKAIAIFKYLKEVGGSNAKSSYEYALRLVTDKDKNESKKYDSWVRETFKYPSYFEYIE
ncbi:tetratricopeptide repeat protein [Larsenimonas suaedae]|uniref:Sel1 repeat family protein n=1 Tax=Larsenimonas suaedae TaxID=1851019 RepID=A0ABU1GXQ5_9GAMM|nr:hypothetical protein [Larsenimonas suaedae]MCM2973220.1 hypothetical protein [Larsenimonas suaedae]MDR5896113.1 hypothetical protein [Larsenimonas suaedae]